MPGTGYCLSSFVLKLNDRITPPLFFSKTKDRGRGIANHLRRAQGRCGNSIGRFNVTVLVVLSTIDWLILTNKVNETQSSQGIKRKKGNTKLRI
jgi:hypothetical protein